MSDESKDVTPHSQPLRVRPNTVERILRSRAPEARGEPQTNYQAFTLCNSGRQTGFSIQRNNGELDGFMYHNLSNMNVHEVRSTDYLTFDHCGKAVTLAGRNLKILFHKLMSLSVSEIFEHSGGEIAEGEPCITRIEMTMVR